jgi:hypothetical protein
MMEKLIDYFQGESDKLQSHHSTSSVFQNRSDIGYEREQSFEDFLKIHIPKRCEVDLGGFVFDANNQVSKQIDIIISNDFTLQFKDRLGSAKSFNCIEGCNAVFSIKSNLNKDQMKDSIQNLASVPLSKEILFNPSVKNIENISKQTPLKVIFSYEGINTDTLLKDMIEHQKQKNIPTESMPDFIIVNKKFYAWKNIIPTKVINNDKPDQLNYGDYCVEDGYNKIGGIALLHLLTTIQKISNLSIVTLFNFSKYFEKAYEYLDNNKQNR